jgi:hypothetical protein
LNPAQRVGAFGWVASGEDHFGAGSRQFQGCFKAKAACGSGDQSQFALLVGNVRGAPILLLSLWHALSPYRLDKIRRNVILSLSIDILTKNVNTRAGKMRETMETDKETRVIEAAKRVFVRYGFRRVTMQDIAEEAGILRLGA